MASWQIYHFRFARLDVNTKVLKLLVTIHIANSFDCPTACRPVDTAPPEYENEGFILKMQQMFSVHSTPEELENNYRSF